jgi:hypothetical protein
MESPHRTTLAWLVGLAALLAALAAMAIAAGGTYAKPPDLNGEARAVDGSVVDVRSPDRQSPAPQQAPERPAAARDAISPDAADVASPGRTPVSTGVRAGRPSVDGSADDGLEWWSAAAGAGAIIAIGLAGLTAFAVTSRRRGAPGANPTTVATGH